jgi:septum formation topological specificity factor MinE
MAGYDEMGNPVGRDVTFGRGADAPAKSFSAGSSDDAAAERVAFWGKVKAAFAIFFPPSEEETARLEAKKRLRMILVADRCAMSGAAMSAMKARVVEVVGEFLDVDEDAEVDIATTQDPTGESITTMYAVSIPVRGVKPQFDVENETYGWDEEPTDAPYDDDAWAEAAEAAETSDTK